ncbi:MAG: hypothetical protein KC503_17880 [Myxococcales bacterium]|nr:hypothetical protein [Myxococcales bacterium]
MTAPAAPAPTATGTRRALAVLVTIGVVAAAMSRCVSTVETERTPCPCASGATCCGSLGVCLPPGESCPARYPSSSKRACARNADCPRGEACNAWRLPAGSDSGVDATPGDGGDLLVGPRTCHRVCTPAFSCAAGELCQLALQDGRPLAEAYTASLCLDDVVSDARPDARDAGSDGDSSSDADATVDVRDDIPGRDVTVDTLAECSVIGCAKCPPSKIGRTYCDGRAVKVCYSALHARCGLVCEQLTWQCDQCNELNGIVSCIRGSSTTPPGVCAASMDCSNCPRGGIAAYCERNTLRGCVRGSVSIPDEPCSGEVCIDKVLEVCTQGCDPVNAVCR